MTGKKKEGNVSIKTLNLYILLKEFFEKFPYLTFPEKSDCGSKVVLFA